MDLNGKLTDNQLDSLFASVANYWSMRRQLAQGFDDRRSVADECGYPREVQDISIQDYQRMYDLEPISNRVCEVLPKEAWQVQPSIYETEDVEKKTPFEEAVDGLSQTIRGENSWYADEEGSCLWEYALRADIQCGIGHYGIILIGATEDKVSDLEQPLPFRQRGQKEAFRKLAYLRVFPEAYAQVAAWESDTNSSRFGQPLSYQVNFSSPDLLGGVGLSVSTATVHWSRIVHIPSDNRTQNEWLGVPRMRPVWRRLLDLQKVYGASGETYWRNCVLKLFFGTDSSLGGDVRYDKEGFRSMMENMMNGLQQWAAVPGFNVNTVAPAVSDPTAFINTAIEAICITLGIPVRIFKGSERGELASSQDDAAWNDRVRARQKFFVTPRIIVPLIDRFIALGILPVPTEGYKVFWPDIASQTDQEKAQVALIRTQALAQAIGGDVFSVIPEKYFLTKELHYTDSEADAVLEEAVQREADLQEQQAQQQAQQPPPEMPTGEQGNQPQQGNQPGNPPPENNP